MTCKKLTIEELDQLLLTKPNASGFATESLCLDACGTCCTVVNPATCVWAPAIFASDVRSNPCCGNGGGCCQEAYLTGWVYQYGWNTVDSPAYDGESGPANVQWKPGYPASLAGTEYRWAVTFQKSEFFGAFMINDYFCYYDEEAGREVYMDCSGVYTHGPAFERIVTKKVRWRLYQDQCGIAVDVTDQAVTPTTIEITVNDTVFTYGTGCDGSQSIQVSNLDHEYTAFVNVNTGACGISTGFNSSPAGMIYSAVDPGITQVAPSAPARIRQCASSCSDIPMSQCDGVCGSLWIPGHDCQSLQSIGGCNAVGP